MGLEITVTDTPVGDTDILGGALTIPGGGGIPILLTIRMSKMTLR
jgi:hypothetical protein